MKTHTILLVTNLKPWPAHAGHYIRCQNVIDSLSQCFRLILLTPQVDADCEVRQRVEAWYTLPEPRQSLPVLDRLNHLQYLIRPNPAWVERLQAVYRQHKLQVTWFEQMHWGQYVPLAQRHGSLTIMDTANIQSDLTRQFLSTVPPGPNYVRRWVVYQLQRWHEHTLFRHFDHIVSVSEVDRRYHARFVGDQLSKLVPNYVHESWYEPDLPMARDDDTVVATASFNAFQNRAGTEWLLTKVWPEVCEQHPQARLNLVGRGAEIFTALANDLSGVRCVGEVPSAAPYLRQAAVSVVPILNASGSRLKILEALACSVPVVSTSLGAQGIDVVSGESGILADSATDFALAILALLKDQAKSACLARNGLELLRREYSFEVNTERIRQLVEELVRHG